MARGGLVIGDTGEIPGRLTELGWSNTAASTTNQLIL